MMMERNVKYSIAIIAFSEDKNIDGVEKQGKVQHRELLSQNDSVGRRKTINQNVENKMDTSFRATCATR